jgi:DNA-binding Lrp family transcriptional regulator
MGAANETAMSATLTARQAEVESLRDDQKLTFAEVAEKLGISVTTANEHYRAAKHKRSGALGTNAEAAAKVGVARQIENSLPVETAVKLIDGLTDPFKRITEAAKDAGLKPEVINGLVRRMKTRYLGVTEQMRAIKTQDIIHKLDERIGHALNFVDEYVMADANFRDLAMGISVLIEKRQLLKGEPTAIISNLDREKLQALLPMIVKEIHRRGLTIDSTATVVREPA